MPYNIILLLLFIIIICTLVSVNNISGGKIDYSLLNRLIKRRNPYIHERPIVEQRISESLEKERISLQRINELEAKGEYEMSNKIKEEIVQLRKDRQVSEARRDELIKILNWFVDKINKETTRINQQIQDENSEDNYITDSSVSELDDISSNPWANIDDEEMKNVSDSDILHMRALARSRELGVAYTLTSSVPSESEQDYSSMESIHEAESETASEDTVRSNPLNYNIWGGF